MDVLGQWSSRILISTGDGRVDVMEGMSLEEENQGVADEDGRCRVAAVTSLWWKEVDGRWVRKSN